MARIELSDGVTLSGARRILTKRESSFRITMRYGRLYTIRKVACNQPNTDAQMECRAMLMEANRKVKDDMAREGRKEYWTMKAKEMGYKTAVGCARAWYLSEMRGKELKEKEMREKEMAKRSEEKEKVEVDDKMGRRSVETVETGRKETEKKGWNMSWEQRRKKRETNEVRNCGERDYGDVIIIEKRWRRVLSGSKKTKRVKSLDGQHVTDGEKKELLIL